MPKPNSNNRISFKNYLRANKQKFTSGIQTCILGDIQDAILTLKSGINTSQVTRVIIFDDGERVGLSTILKQKQLFYVPALPGDSITIGVGTAGDVGIKSYRGYKLTFVGDGQGVEYGNQIYGLNSTIGLGTDTSLTIVGLGGGLFLPGDPPTYAVTPSSTNVYEGNVVSFAVTTTNIGIGTTLYYSIVGSASSSDFLDNTLTGSFTIQGISNDVGFATFTKTIATDAIYDEVTEGFVLNILTGAGDGTGSVVATSSTVYITNLGEPSYSVGVSTTSISEGGSVNIITNTVNVGSGTTLYYSTTTSMSGSDFSDGSLTGSFNIVGTGATTGIGTTTRTIAYDLLTEGTETFVISVRTGSTSGPIVATGATISVVDVAPTFSVTPSVNSVDEGSSVTFTVTTTGVSNGTTLYWSTLPISQTVSAEDFSDSTLSGSFAINNNSGTVTRTIASDLTTEGPEIFKIQIRTGSVTGTIVATSSQVTINDTSLTVGQNANGLTFGPVQVNRDNSSTAIASDWYTICNLDTLPEGSSIALFIDNSGSMTSGTVQASYDLLLEKLAAKNITITTVVNGNEDWITPFLVDLP